MDLELTLNSPYMLLMLFMMVLLVGQTVLVLSDTYIERGKKTRILLIIALVVSLILQNGIEFYLGDGPARPMLRTIVSIYGYVLRPIPIVLFHDLVGRNKYRRLTWILVAVNAAVYLTALFSPLAFRINSENSFERGPLGYTCHTVTGVFLANFLWTTFRLCRGENWRQVSMPVFNSIVIVGAVLLDAFITIHPVTFLSIAMVSSTILFYIWLHIKFMRDHEEDLKARQRIQIMMSQIQPHFLYNTLSTIQVLCHLDPDKAADVTEQFSLYLRQNLESLSQPGLISFWKELEHTKVYVKIEETRFPNVHVRYHVEDGDFRLPSLTLQPMVENAIRYGVRIREEGLVDVSVSRTNEEHVLVIRDNGVGFDVKKLETMQGTHIGIRNVRERIESMCQGTFELESTIGVGTTITIRIPRSQTDSEPAGEPAGQPRALPARGDAKSGGKEGKVRV